MRFLHHIVPPRSEYRTRGYASVLAAAAVVMAGVMLTGLPSLAQGPQGPPPPQDAPKGEHPRMGGPGPFSREQGPMVSRPEQEGPGGRPGQRDRQRDGGPGMGRAQREGGHFAGQFSDPMSTGPERRGGFDELKDIPTLEGPIREIGEIHQERVLLRKERARIATETGRPKDTLVKEFHELLRREDELTTRQRRVMKEIGRDAAKIRAEAEARRAATEESLRALKEQLGDNPMQSAEYRSAIRSLRFYESVDERLREFEENPDRENLIHSMLFRSMFLRGTWNDTRELDPAVVEQTRRQVRDLRQQQEKLERRMDEIERQLDEMEDVINAAGPPASPPPAPAPPPQPPRRPQDPRGF